MNKVSTKVILFFDVMNSAVLDEEQRERLFAKLASRISKEGLMQLSSGTKRTQGGNRRLVVEKFIRLIEKAFHVPIKRISTRPTAGSKERRLQEKKSVSGKKATRSANFPDSLTDE